MGEDHAIIIDVARPLHIDEIDLRRKCRTDIHMSIATIRGDDWLHRRRANRTPVDCAPTKSIRANFDRVIVGVQRADYIDGAIRPFLVDGDDELHSRKAYREHQEGTVSRGGAETRRGVALFSATPRLRVNMYSGCHAAPTYRGHHPAHLSGARA